MGPKVLANNTKQAFVDLEIFQKVGVHADALQIGPEQIQDNSESFLS
jgi:hypothetical protein